MDRSVFGKILVTLAFIFIYRALSYVPIPGVDPSSLRHFFASNSDNALGLFNMFSGNAVERLSVISLGVMPYITASIVMELLSATFVGIAKMKKERDGVRKYTQIVRYLTVFITIIQSLSVSYSLNNFGDGSAVVIDLGLFMVVSVFSMLTGTMLLVWIGDQITQHGVGNGVSLIIFSGIVSGMPTVIATEFSAVSSNDRSVFALLGMFAMIAVTVCLIIYFELAERRIPVSYARKVMMQNRNKRVMNYIPMKINLTGVIPPIFASAILIFPSTLLQASSNKTLLAVSDFMSPSGYFYNFAMFVLIVFFAYFYASIVFNSRDISDNLKRQGGYIPGLRPGESTALYLNSVATRLTFWGALYLGLVSTMPWLVLRGMGVQFFFGGTSVLIVVQVAIDTVRKIEAQVYMNRYKTLGSIGI